MALGFGEAPGQKGPLVVLGFGGRSYKRPLVKKGPWWLWRPGRAPWSKRAPGGFGVRGGVLQEALGQIWRGPPKSPWSKGPLMVLEARARPLVKNGLWWFWGLGGPLVKKGAVLQEAPGQKGP